MACSRCRQCLDSFRLDPAPTTELSDTASRGCQAELCVDSGAPQLVFFSQFRTGNWQVLSANADIGASPVMFTLTIRNGDAVWQIRRRFQQVRSLHQALSQTYLARGLPAPPPRATCRSLVFGQRNARFLDERAARIQDYLRALTTQIPVVEQCEALYQFLCYLHLPRWRGDRVLVGGGAPPVDPDVVTKLPRAPPPGMNPDTVEAPKASVCVVCQEVMEAKEDIRVFGSPGGISLPAAILSMPSPFSLEKTTKEKPLKVPDGSNPTLTAVAEEYEKALDNNKSVDYTDLISMAGEVLRLPVVAETMAKLQAVVGLALQHVLRARLPKISPLSAMSSIGSDYALLAESEKNGLGGTMGFLGNLEHLLGGALRSHQHSRSDLDENERRNDRGRTAPTAQTLWDPSNWGASSGAQSPMKGSESPLTVVAAEDMPGSPGRSSPQQRAMSPKGRHEKGVQDPEAPMLHQVLEQLYSALKAWEASVKASTSLTGAFLPDRDYRQEERAVNVASIAFEEFHAKLGQKSFMQRLGAGMSQDDDQRAMVRGQELLQALEGLSPWADAKKIQELLRLRQDYFLDMKWDPERSRFSCAELFLQLVHDKQRWPEAEVLAMRWPENLERMLGNTGAEAWLSRAKRWRQRRQANPKKLRQTNEELEWCGLPNLLEGTANHGGDVAKPVEVSGCLTFTKIKARNLRSADLMDESDPFVKFELGTLTRPQITSTVWNNEKNPEWKDSRTGAWEIVRMPVAKASREKFPELQISVFDEDTFSANDPLGSRTLPILDLIETNAGQRLGSIGKEVTFHTGPLDLMGTGAGDRNPYLEMEITWTPEGVGVLAAPSDPLLLPPQDDAALHLLAAMEEQLPAFLRDFGPNSAENLGFFLQRKDHRLDSALPHASPAISSSGSDKVRQYNQVLNRINEHLQQFRRKHHEPNFAELGVLLEKARDFERSVGSRADLRRIFAFQDEHFHDIGEWSTDRRRQLRNQVFLVKLAHSGTAGGALDTLQMDVRFYVVMLFLLALMFFMCLDFWALGHLHDQDGRGWILVLSNLMGFFALAAVFVVSFPKWKHYFEKPKSGVNTYQTVPPA
eukprot:s33_g89.t1